MPFPAIASAAPFRSPLPRQRTISTSAIATRVADGAGRSIRRRGCELRGFGREGDHHLCLERMGTARVLPRCGSNLWHEFLPTGRRSFLAGIFDAAGGYPVAKEIFVDEQPEWYVIPGDHPRQTGEDVIAEAEAAGFSFE